MKINIILPGAGLSGGVRVVFQYANWLIRNGNSVKVYYPLKGSYYGWKRILALKAILRQLILPELKGNWFEKDFELLHPLSIKNETIENADITIATSWHTAYWVSELNPSKGKKVYFIQDYEVWGDAKKRKLARESYHFYFDKYITVSTALKEKLKRLESIEAVVVCNGIPREEVGTTFKNSEDEIVVSFPYRNDRKEKNCDFGIAVLEAIEKKYNIKIMSYGLQKPKNWNSEWIYLENPSRDDLYDFYEKTNIFYLPSTYEGWGLPAMEAMGHGAAIVCGNFGVIAEFGEDLQNCYVIENPLNKDEVMEKISFLIENPLECSRIGKNAYRLIKEQYTVDRQAYLFEKELKDIV